MSSSHAADAPSRPSRRTVILSAGALGILLGLRTLLPDAARSAAGTAQVAGEVATDERPHRTLLGVL
jgi:hypothetical protein